MGDLQPAIRMYERRESPLIDMPILYRLKRQNFAEGWWLVWRPTSPTGTRDAHV